MHSSSRLRVFILPALVVLFVATRLGMVHTTGHLLFHIDAGEYGIFKGLRLYLDTPSWEVLADREQRFRFALAMAQVADGGLHTTLVLAGFLAHIAVVEWGWPLGTITIRHLAVIVSTTAFLVWTLRLHRSLGDGGRLAWRVGLLWLAAPPMFMKLSVLYWGTHEMVILLYALFIGALGGWVGNARGPVLSFLRATLIGSLGAVAMAANTSLILPCAFFGLWLSGESVWGAAKSRGWKTATLTFVGMATGGVVSFGTTWWLLCKIEVLATLGLTSDVFSNDKLNHLEGSASFMGPEHWWMSLQTCSNLWPLMAAAACVLFVSWRRRGSEDPALLPPHAFVQFCATYLFVGWFAISCLPFAYGVPATVFIERYTAHLYPVGFVAFAWVAMDLLPRVRGVRLGNLLLVAWLVVYLPGQFVMIDLGNLEAGRRYDGVRVFFTTFGGDTASESPPNDRLRFGDKSESFIRGLGLIQSYQRITYWGWKTPGEAAKFDHAGGLWHLPGERNYDLEAEDFDRADYFRGAGFAYRLVFPPSRKGELDAVWDRFPDETPWILEGYEMPLPGDD